MLPSTTNGSVKISTLVAASKESAHSMETPLFLRVSVGVLDPDLLVTLKDFIIIVSEIRGLNKVPDSAYDLPKSCGLWNCVALV